MRAVALVGVLAAVVVPVREAAAQQVQVQVARGPHYLGEPIEIDVVAEGFDEEPEPSIAAPAVAGGTLELLGVSPNMSRSFSIVNGRMTSSHSVTFVYQFRFLPTTAGAAHVGAFVVEQGAEKRATAALELDVRSVPTSDALALEVALPEGPVVVGQKVPIALELWIDRELQRDLVSYAIDVPLFARPELRFLDDPPADANTELQVQTATGTLLIPARSREATRDGRRFLVVRAPRTMIALAPGAVAAPPATVVVDQGTQFRRDLFRQRRATASRKIMASSAPASVTAREVPAEGRPATFAGAIGRGFALEVSADRSVVQVGEPIALSFTLRGDGDLSTAGLPPLDAPGVLDAADFRVPDDAPTGVVDEAGKHFEVMVRVLDGAVREIPSLEYTWFDPESGRFETTRSRPIALSVTEAEIVGADAVERRDDDARAAGADEAGARDEDARTSDEPRDARATGAAGAAWPVAGANLAVERDVARLARDERPGGRSSLPALASLYALGAGLVGVAWIDRRRRGVAPEVLERRRASAHAERDVARALDLPEREAAERIARALRAMLAQTPNAATPELDALLGELDARSYAPPTTARDPLPEALRERARACTAALAEAAR